MVLCWLWMMPDYSSGNIDDHSIAVNKSQDIGWEGVFF